jgi:uncharacterized protein (DUF2141 family)
MKNLISLALLAPVVGALGANLSGTIGYPGSQAGAVRITASQSFSGNKVLKLSGTGTVSVDTLTSLGGPELTIQFWFKGSTVQSAVRQQTGGYIIAGYNNGHLTSTDGALAGAVGGVNDGNWHHIIMTRKRGGKLAGYVDGQLKGSIPAANADLPNLAGPVYFGSLANLGEFTVGELDEIAIWSRALSESEIAAGWSSALSPGATGLVGYWKFDDDTYNDSTANAHTGYPLGDAQIVSDDIPVYSQTVQIEGPGTYTITGLPLGTGYSLTAFKDVNGDAIRQSSEPFGTYSGNPFTLTGDKSGVDLTLTEPPYITQQPQAPPGNRVAAGGTVAFSVSAQGTAPLSFQWFRDGAALANSARVTGANSPTLQINGLAAGDAGGYSVKVSNPMGSTTSLAPQLYVIVGGQTIAGEFLYQGVATGMVHTSVAQLRQNNKVLNLSLTSTNYAVTTLTDVSGDELTIEYWFKGSGLYSAVRQQGGPGYIVAGWGDGQHILSNDGGTAGVRVSRPANLVTDGNWHHVAVTWRRNTVNGFVSYLDGELVDQRNSADAPVPNIGTQVYFGAFAGMGEFMQGMLDEIAIWGVALTRTDIRSHALNGLVGNEAGLKGYWNFDDGTGRDLSAGGNHAELFNGATIDTAVIPGQGAVYPDAFPGPGAFSIAAIPPGNNYSLTSFLDANGNGTLDLGEPQGAYAGNPFSLQGPLTGAQILLFDPPVISTNPLSVTVPQGGTIVLTATLSGTSNSLQWSHYSTVLADGGRVSGARSNVLTITGAQMADAGAYSLAATNPAGSAVSAPAAVIVQPAHLTNDLVAHWKFDDASGGIAKEATGLAQEGLLNNFPGDGSEWVAGIVGGALRFSEANQSFVLASDYPKAASTLSASAWVWADSLPAWASIAKNWGQSQAGQFHFGLHPAGGELSGIVAGSGGGVFEARDTVSLPLGSWQHVAFVADGARVHLYRNGVEVASAAYGGTLNQPPMASLGIGAKTDDSGSMAAPVDPGFWDGRLDDLGVWNRALSSAEVLGLYREGLNGVGIAGASAVVDVALSITINNGQVTLHYAAGTLEWAVDLGGPWSAVPGASAPAYTLPATGTQFFRVR